MSKTNIYIDGNNLYRSARELGFNINYRKFRNWLRQKFYAEKVYIFIGFISENIDLYKSLEDYGYILIFKQTVLSKEKIKGNCDAELVLKVVSDFYTKNTDLFILITGDGDFGCLVDFLKENKALNKVLAPDKHKCSFLIRNKNCEITFLNSHYHKFSSQNKKAPDADLSA